MFIKVGVSPHIYERQFIFEHLLIHRNLMIHLTQRYKRPLLTHYIYPFKHRGRYSSTVSINGNGTADILIAWCKKEN